MVIQTCGVVSDAGVCQTARDARDGSYAVQLGIDVAVLNAEHASVAHDYESGSALHAATVHNCHTGHGSESWHSNVQCAHSSGAYLRTDSSTAFARHRQLVGMQIKVAPVLPRH